jgi:hypothetical protein
MPVVMFVCTFIFFNFAFSLYQITFELVVTHNVSENFFLNSESKYVFSFDNFSFQCIFFVSFDIHL